MHLDTPAQIKNQKMLTFRNVSDLQEILLHPWAVKTNATVSDGKQNDVKKVVGDRLKHQIASMVYAL